MFTSGLDRGNVMQYSPGVLVGNWQEEACQREAELKEYKARKALLASGQRQLAASLGTASAATTLAEADMMESKRLMAATYIPAAGPLDLARYGTPITIMNVKHNAVLAVDVSPSVAPGPGQIALTCSPATATQVRSTWVLEPCRDENNAAYRARAATHDAVHYGQRVRIANETVAEAGFYYVHSALEAGQLSSVPQRAVAALGVSADNVFVVCKPGVRRDAVGIVGDPVRVGSPIVLVHSITNRPLCCTGAWVRTSSYGMEFALTCAYANGGSFTRTRAGVAVREENVFCIAAGQGATQKMAKTMPITCGEGVGEVIGRVRAAVLAAGGRLGFRAASRAMGVAAEEDRRLIHLNQVQLLAFAKATLGVELAPIEADAIMKRFDRTGSNVVCAQELMSELRGHMTPERLEAVALVYNQLMMEGAGCVEFINALHLYRANASAHPDVVDGLVCREQIILDFERCWPGRVGTKLGTVTRDEFTEYYTDLSPTFDEDERFFAMLRACWAVPAMDDYRRGVPRRSIVVLHQNDLTETVAIPDTLVIDVADRKAVESILIRHGVRNIKDFTVTR